MDSSYQAITQNLTRVMNRLKALYRRSWAMPCAGERVYARRHRSEWLAKISPHSSEIDFRGERKKPPMDFLHLD